MGKIGWVCATCMQDFTRRYSAERHNNHLHFGKSKIVRLLEYIIGRVSGEYIACNPSLYRRYKTKKEFLFGHNANTDEGGYAAVTDMRRDEFSCGTKKESMIKGSKYKQDNPSLHELSQPVYETLPLDKAVSSSLDGFQTMGILCEVNNLVRGWCSTKDLENILMMWKVHLMTSNTGNIYKSLEWLRELSKSKSSVQPVSREVLASFDWIWRWAADNRIKISDDVPKIYLTGYSDVSHSTSPNKLRQAISTNVSSSIISQGLAKQRIPEIPSPPEIPYKSINESSSS